MNVNFKNISSQHDIFFLPTIHVQNEINNCNDLQKTATATQRNSELDEISLDPTYTPTPEERDHSQRPTW